MIYFDFSATFSATPNMQLINYASPTQIPEIKITQHHYLTGADMKKGMEKISGEFTALSQYTILTLIKIFPVRNWSAND